ncbi:hypothetical protein K7X08_008707 [Anisodus acutangulus]|uniref:Ribosomal protein L1 n=1 Tax=Anisodus acutangulus TaxID=402998 RepID=A0A9Q1RTC9_9SOLA|nr:hypothetical protein K7X08_008707 [Anisodus acutangulus]
MESPPPSATTKVSRATVEKGVDALLKWKETKSKIQKPQLLPQDDFIYVNLTLKKIPPKPRTNAFRIPFPHPLHDDSSELCFIIDDRPNSKLTSDAAKKIIKSHNIPITKVIKLSKLKTNYKSFEAKRKLCDSYDLFLVDRRIVHLLPKLLGKQFFKKKKLPLPLDLTHKNWKEQVERACGSGLFYLRTGTCCMMRIGKGSMDPTQIVDNVVEAIKGVVQVVPKKWGGVRSLHLRLSDSLALPLYQALPEMKLKIQGFKEKEAEEVSGDLVEVKESGKKAEEGSGKKKGKNKGRIHEVRYMDFDTGVDVMGSDDDVENVGKNEEEERSDEDIEESEDHEVEKVKKGKTEKGSIEKKAKKLKKAEQEKKSKLSVKDGKKKKKSTEVEKKLKDGPVKQRILALPQHLLVLCESQLLGHFSGVGITSWASQPRKLVLSKKQSFSMFMNELIFSSVILSYSPKSEQAWSQRRWVIKMIAGNCSNLQEIMERESDLVKKLAESYARENSPFKLGGSMIYDMIDFQSWDDFVRLVAEKEELLKMKDDEFQKMKDKALRSYAEMENVMNRAKREAENSKKFAIQNFVKAFLDVADNMGRASSVVKESFSKIDESKDTVGAVPLLKTLDA